MQVVSTVGLKFQEFKDLFELSGLVPSLEVAVAGAVRDAKVMGEVIPAAASRQDVENAVGNVLKIGLGSASGAVSGEEMRRQQLKLLVRQVAGVRFAFWFLSVHMSTI